METSVLEFRELVDKLTREHDNNCYYRGQTMCYDYPLWPSMYRGAVIGASFKITPPMKSRLNQGKHYVYRSQFLADERYCNPDFLSKREKIRAAMCVIRNALGYCISEAMFQQAGWSSEGLDVTSDINIALFFATHIYRDQKYYSDNSDNVHVLYRWKIPHERWSFAHINSTNFHNSPRLFPTKDVINLFGECDSYDEFKQSIEEYREAIGWGMGFDAYSIRNCRPFEIIKIPKEWKQKSRIVRQSASLMFPDSIAWEEFCKYKRIAIESELYNEYGFFLEDLSMSDNCDIFLFKADGKDICSLNIDSGSVYIEDDLSHRFLNGWLETQERVGFHTDGIPMIFTSKFLSELRYQYTNTWGPGAETEFHG